MLGLTPLIFILRRADREKREREARAAAMGAASGGAASMDRCEQQEVLLNPGTTPEAVCTPQQARAWEYEEVAEGTAVATGNCSSSLPLLL